MRYISLLPFLLLSTLTTNGQDTTRAIADDFYSLSLEQLLDVKISVASVKELNQRESPGILTVITEEEIKNSGARDLMDVLRLVPGFDFGVDVEGVIGVGVRGNWAHEGKVLLMIDGHEMTENLFSTLQFGNHYPVENIYRIEIIRGPGSVVYGGTAEYAVINMISKKPEDLKGVAFAGYAGFMSKQSGQRGHAMQIGDKNNGFAYSLSTNFSYANRSQDNYSDVYGDKYNMAGQSGIKNAYVSSVLEYNGYELSALIDNYGLETRDAYLEILSLPYFINFDSYSIALKKKYSINDRLHIIPRISYQNQSPWRYDLPSINDEFAAFHINTQRSSASVMVDYNVTKNLNLVSGAECFRESAVQKINGAVFSSNDAEKVSYVNTAVFSQLWYKTRWFNITAGARYNVNSWYDDSFVPRFAITKSWDRFHAKLLYSYSFRAPNIMNLDYGINIKPENTRVTELEVGYMLGTKVFFTINAFDITTSDPIIYYYGEANGDTYMNFEETGTQGFEAGFKYKHRHYDVSANYSFYTVENKKSLDIYSVPYNNNAMLAFPAHKLNLLINRRLLNSCYLHTSISFFGPRYGITSYDEGADEAVYKKFNSYTIVDIGFSYKNLLLKNLEASVSVHNILDRKDMYIQPYNSLHAPLPANNREFSLTFRYRIAFENK